MLLFIIKVILGDRTLGSIFNSLGPMPPMPVGLVPSIEEKKYVTNVLLDFSLTVKAVTLIFISGWGSAISSAKEGKSGFIYNLVKKL